MAAPTWAARHALVIGNENYQHLPKLKTPVAVLRAGLGELIAYGGQTPEART